MRKILLTAAAAALAVGTLMSAAGSAEARPGYRQNDGARYATRRGGNRAGAAVAAGVAGALVGGAIAAGASRQQGYYDQPYGGRYGAPAYGPGPGGYSEY